MYFTGFADEAGRSIDAQIAATRELGWKYIESRNIDGVNIHNISDRKFDEVAGKLAAAGISINCFGSEVANWGKDPFKEEDFELSIAMLERSLKRMETLGCKMIRGMSFAQQKQREPFDPEVEAQVFPKVDYLVKMCENAGVIYGHENCMNYGGQSYQHTLKLIEKIKSPAFKIIFDTGNPVFTDLRIGEKPYKKQDAWEFYINIREHIHYVHIKDAKYETETEGVFPKSNFTWAGEGDGKVREIVADLIRRGYDGGFSMEPHMQLVFHEDDNANVREDAKLRNYIEYGKRFMQLVENARKA